jgi:hypothetical protein
MLFNDYKNVKTIIFSELPQQDKIKYFNFLLENDINFSRDETGNYVALVKVLNPAFYSGAEGTPNPNTSPVKKTQSNVDESKKEDEKDGIKIISDKKKGQNASKSMPKNVANKSKQGNYKGYSNYNEDNSIKNKKKNPHKSNEHFEKDKKVMQKKNFLDLFEGRYQKFIEIVNPLVGIRGKRMNLNELRYCIEEIYSIRFINDTNNIKENNGEGESFPFPNFVLEFMYNKYIKKPAVDQHSLDLILSIDFFKNKDTIISIFSKFLNEELDPDDLEFYLYVRSCIEKELNTMFIEIARQQTKKGTGLNEEEKEKSCLTIKSCLNLANNIYGEDQEELLNNFMNKIEEILTEQKNNGVKKNLIEADKILFITLNDYHENKYRNNGNNNNFDGKTKLKNVTGNNKLSTYENIQKSYGQTNVVNQEEKINRLKIILCTYIKEKELDVFFDKLLTSYMVYEKSKNNVEEIMAGIKELVSKKVNLLIKILFDGDEKAWFNSLKLNETDKDAKDYFVNLNGMIYEMLQIEKLSDIPENKVELFGQTLLSTPELNNQINKLVMKRFE